MCHMNGPGPVGTWWARAENVPVAHQEISGAPLVGAVPYGSSAPGKP